MFTDQEKAIFDYFDGSETVVFGDPLAIQRRLTKATKGQLGAWIDDYNPQEGREVDPVQRALVSEKLVPAIVEAFELVPYDKKTGRGCNEASCLELLAKFLDFMAQKKTDSVKSPTSPAPMGPGPGTATPTKSSSGSGRTLIDSISKPPTRSPKALPPR